MVVFACLASGPLPAQQPPVHFLHPAGMPPGVIGNQQLQRGGPLPGYFQPVEIKTPEGVRVALAEEGRFGEPQNAPFRVGFLIGQVYRLRLMNLPLQPGVEVFPTIEVIDRIYAPRGQELRFPLIIEIGPDDLQAALSGKFVTRVVYLEDPDKALPVQEAGKEQDWFDVAPGTDPLAVADALGRPVAIVRMGARVPERADAIDMAFLYGCPPWIKFAPRHASPVEKPPRTGKPGASDTTPRDSSGPQVPLPGANPEVSPGVQGEIALPYAASGPWAPPGISQPWPKDEYLADGGDRGIPVGVGRNGQVRGLDVQDTIAHYDTLDGRTLVQPTNRVWLYSPRFRAVRHVVGVRQGDQVEGLSGVYQPERLAMHGEVQTTWRNKQNLQAARQVGQKSLTAFRARQWDGAMSSAIGPRGFQDAFLPYENLTVIRTGRFEMAEKAWLARGVSAAIAWSKVQAVQIILDNKAASAVVQNEQAETIFAVEEPPAHPRLRVIKVASTPFAEPGDVVDFTIRFDNVGNQPIGNVTILDNLTTRLEYVPDTAQSSLPASFSTSANEAGSLVLRWEITNRLEPLHGGIVRFRCRVR
jgi:uncharacterized repeat protein (TIGR01451 family)